MTKKEITKTEISRILGINKNTITNWEKNRPILYEIVMAHFKNEKITTNKTDISEVDRLSDIPFFTNIYAAAGDGSIFDEEAEKENILIDRVLLNTGLNIRNTANIEIIKVSGDSMEPLIQNGDIIIVDRRTDAVSGNIVIANINGHVLVKKIVLDPFEKWVKLVSENAHYDEIVVEGEDLERFCIVGIVRAKIKVL